MMIVLTLPTAARSANLDRAERWGNDDTSAVQDRGTAAEQYTCSNYREHIHTY